MSKRGSMTPWLLGAVVVLGGVVVVKQLMGGAGGGGSGSGESGGPAEAPTARERYLEALALSRRQQALLDAADPWRSAEASAERAWESARREVVRARTLELAEAGFRERVLAEVKDLRFSESGANSVPAGAEAAGGAPGAAPAVRAIGLRVEVRTDTPGEVYRLVDRIENLPDVRAGVVGVQIKGPGLAQTPGEVTATIDVRGIALIGEETP